MTEKCIACSSCGYPMTKPEHHALNNINSEYCPHCTDAEGKLLPYEIILENNISYYQSSQGISESAARKMAVETLSTLPAWKNK